MSKIEIQPVGTLLESVDIPTPEAMAKYAAGWAERVKPGDALAFYGDLGSGKTFFVKALCAALRTDQEPTSPTFTLINEYRTSAGMYVYHFDFYRLDHAGELANLGLEEYFYNEHLCLIEWADKIVNFLPAPRYDCYIDILPEDPQARRLHIYRVDG